MSENRTQSVPQALGPYRVLEEVGSGGLGRVFRAIDKRSGRTVAVKILHDHLVQQKRFLGTFHRELLIMSRLNHPHIVSYLDSYFQPPVCYVVTDFIKGMSGYSLIRKVRRVPPLVALSIVIDILQGLDHLHLHDIIHSDLSAANYMVDSTGRVYVMDFGLSCQLEIEDYKDYMMGTPGYYSPEHISEAAIGKYSDVYCAGLILFELIAGRRAVPAAKDRHEVLEEMKKIDFKAVVCSDSGMEKSLRRLLKRTLAFKYGGRWQSIDAMMHGCLEILTKFQIRYTRHVIANFLRDNGLVSGPARPLEVDIYLGSR